MSTDEQRALELLRRAADHLEIVADIIFNEIADIDPEDDNDEREFIAEIREFLGHHEKALEEAAENDSKGG